MTGVVAIGECMLELSPRGGDLWRLSWGGDTLNTSVYLSRLGIPVAYLTAVGADPFSLEMTRGWAAEGVALDLVLTDPDRLPGLYAIRTAADGERSFAYWREASAARRLFALPGIDAALDRAARARLLYLSGITLSLFDEEGRAQLVALCRAVRAARGLVAFDPNYRARLWPAPAVARAAFATIAPHVSFALPTFDDEATLHGDATPDATAARWRGHGVGEVVVKRGAAGCRVFAEDGTHAIPAASGVAVIDTTGAGDAFNAGYLAGRLHGLSPAASAAAANALAGQVVRHRGAIIPRAAMS